MRWLAVALVLFGLIGLWMLPQPPQPIRDIGLVRPLPAGPLRLTVFGTSLSAPPQVWPDRLSRALTLCRATPVTVQRVAGPGKGSDWALGQIAAVAATHPDLVLIEFAINDADLRRGVSLAKAKEQHLRLLAGLQAALPNAALVLMTMSPAHGPRGWIRPGLAAQYAQYHRLADETGVALIDLYARWQTLPLTEQGLQADGLHPDPIIAEAVIVPTIMAVLAQQQKCR